MAFEPTGSAKTCKCDDKFVVFLKSEKFEDILKQAMQNVMGEVIRTILQHQVKDDLCTLLEKVNKMEFDLQCIKLKKCGFQSSVGNHRQNNELFVPNEKPCGLIRINQDDIEPTDNIERNKPIEEKKKILGIVKFFNLDKGYGFISSPDGTSNVFVHKKELIKPATFLREGEKVQFVLSNTKKGPAAKEVAVVEHLQDSPPVSRGERKSYFRNRSKQRTDEWTLPGYSRSSSATNNRTSRASSRGSDSSRGSRQNIPSRTGSTDSRASNHVNRRRKKVMGTLSSTGSEWGSKHSILSDSNQLSLSTLFSYSLSDVYQSYQFCPSDPPASPYFNYQSQE